MKKYLILVLAIPAFLSLPYARQTDMGSLEGVSAADIRSGDVSTKEVLEKSKRIEQERAEAKASGRTPSKRNIGNFSSLGVNYVQVGAAADFLTSSGVTKTGVDARLGFNVNLYKDAGNSGFGVDLYVPLEYTYADISSGYSNEEINMFTFPAYVRPYYAVEISPDFIVKPFVQAGVGGRYSRMDVSVPNMDAWMDGVAFTWAVGGGVDSAL